MIQVTLLVVSCQLSSIADDLLVSGSPFVDDCSTNNQTLPLLVSSYSTEI